MVCDQRHPLVSIRKISRPLPKRTRSAPTQTTRWPARRETSPAVTEQLAGPPAQFPGLASPGVEEAPATIEREPQLEIRHALPLLTIQPRPGVEIDGRDEEASCSAKMSASVSIPSATRALASCSAIHAGWHDA